MNNQNMPPSAQITILTGPQVGTSFQLTKLTMTIGRDPSNDIVITDQSVSRSHARIVYTPSGWSIEKLANNNSLTVNQRQVQQAFIRHNDNIGLGGIISFLFLSASPSSSSGGPDGGYSLSPFSPAVPVPALTPAPVRSSSAPLPPAAQETLFTQRAPQDGAGSVSVPTLEISTNTSRDRQRFQLVKPVISIGRDPKNDIVINEPIVSAFHAQIVRQGSDLVLVHPHPQARQQRTLNGMLYQGRHIRGDEQFSKVLTRGDIFRIGDENGTLVTLGYNDGSGALQEALPEIHPIALGAPVITIGRHSDNMVVLKHPQVSAHHARLQHIPGGYRIIDLGSTNHVYVNGQRVSSQNLNPNDEIRIGPFKLIYTGTQLTQVDESNGIRIDALHLKKTGNNGTILLNDISLVIPPRKFVAVVGGSGAGKSTLMDALNGLRPATEGKVLYNGQDYYRSLAAFSTQLGYVPQDDIVHRDLTVERALYYAAKMRLPEDFTEDQIRQRINEVLADVEMEDRRNLLVSKLSGGQRKRVSIALELLAKPSIFFLDEPTSGLDPGLDRKMMYLLRRLADKGHTIVLVTHATNNINTCDYVCFLGAGGRLVYYGPPDEAKKFFNKSDFAEIYGALEPSKNNPNVAEEAERNFKNSPDYQKYVAEPLRMGPAGRTNVLGQAELAKPAKRGDPWKQFRLLSLRYIELLKNDTGNLLILLLQAPIIGFILLLIITNALKSGTGVFNSANFTSLNPNAADAQKVLFVMAFAAVMFGCINGAREIVKEAAIYRRERAVNLGILPYMFSKIVVLGVLCLFQSAVLVFMVSLVTHMNSSIFLPPPLELYITLALTSLAGLMIGLTVSAVAPNNDRAMSFIPIILIPQVIFSGTIFPLTGGIMQFLGLFFAVRWSMAALGSTIGLNDQNILTGDKLLGDNAVYHNSAGYLFLVWFALIVMVVALGFAIAYFLRKKDVRV
ncbi:MAG TPA: FHA domain-containing protein [Ktedonobacteraceae bacterium]|nr:FHA domain-containing protein [Ktedonobacteraceae bacterium]